MGSCGRVVPVAQDEYLAAMEASFDRRLDDPFNHRHRNLVQRLVA